MTQHPVIQKEVDELLANSGIRLSSDGAGFIWMCFWFLSGLVVYTYTWFLSDLIAIWTYLPLRYQLWDR